MTTTETITESAAMPIETYIEAGQREFAHYARKLAEIEQAADIEPGSLVDALLSGLDYGDAFELAGYIEGGWNCSKSESEIEAALVQLVERWKREDSDNE